MTSHLIRVFIQLTGLLSSLCRLVTYISASPTVQNPIPHHHHQHRVDTTTKVKNVILIIADDLGVRDLGCYHPLEDGPNLFYETPYIDKLASEGMLFENAYSADATCSRSRAGIFTGIHPSRLGVVDIARVQDGFPEEFECFRKLNPDGNQKVPVQGTTRMAQAFQMYNYRTALIGKWHSGNETAGFPSDHGFDVTIGNASGGLNTHFSPYKCGPKCNIEPLPFNMSAVPDGTIMTHHLTKEAISFLEEFQSDPFLLVLSHYAVHAPIQALADDRKFFQDKRDEIPVEDRDIFIKVDGLLERQTQDNVKYGGLLKSLDDSINVLMSALDSLGLSNNTIVVLTSDNGGKAANYNWHQATRSITSNSPFKQGKAYLGDGGIRVPLIIRSPGQVDANIRNMYQSHGTDLFPTLLEMAGLPLMPNDHIDGISLVPAIEDLTLTRGDAMFWQDPEECFAPDTCLIESAAETCTSAEACTDTSMAVRFENWKLIKRFYDDNGNKSSTVELYDLEMDPGELVNLDEVEGSVTEMLEFMLDEWQDKWFDSPFYDNLMLELGCSQTVVTAPSVPGLSAAPSVAVSDSNSGAPSFEETVVPPSVPVLSVAPSGSVAEPSSGIPSFEETVVSPSIPGL